MNEGVYTNKNLLMKRINQERYKIKQLQVQKKKDRIYIELSKEIRIPRVTIRKIIKKKKEIIFNNKPIKTQRCAITGRTRGLIKIIKPNISRMILKRMEMGTEIEQSVPFIGISIIKKIRRGNW